MFHNFSQIDNDFAYYGSDLGAVIDNGHTRFKVWAPLASAVYINLYQAGEGDNLIESLPLSRIDRGVWYIEFFRNLDGVFYTYTFEYNGKKQETIDIYAKACGINGKRGAVVDFGTTNPDKWENVKKPVCQSPCDAIIYETHVRDFSIDETSGIPKEHRGKFSAFCHKKTEYNGVKTCLSHLKELGITHVHLMPVFDFASIDESKKDNPGYNWGYDPLNYNCLEGSYSTNPYDPKVRIREFKELIKTLHQNKIGVIMDVVYNHTFHSEDSSFHKTFPFYYHRTKDGWFSNGSGCGNELASERAMVRKFILDSVEFWAREYKIDGFRFDLMGLIDIETVNLIRAKLNETDPSILMYGEGWTGGESPLESSRLAYKWNSYQFPAVGLFNDNIRDALKGGVFNAYDTGFVSGNFNSVNIIKRSLAGSVPHHQIKGNDEACWAFEPTQTVNYCEAHDNSTLWDKLSVSAKHFSEQDRVKMDKLAAAVVLLSQGVPFLGLGQDFLRSKPKILKEGEEFPNKDLVYDDNSYKSPDETNSIKWNKKSLNYSVFKYYKALIALRKEFPQLRLATKEEVNKSLSFFNTGDDNIIGFTLCGDSSTLAVILNPYPESRLAVLPEGKFVSRLNANGVSSVKSGIFITGSLSVDAFSAEVLLKTE